MENLVFKGDGNEETGNKIIKVLESLGGINSYKLSGCSMCYYYIYECNDTIYIDCVYEYPFGCILKDINEYTETI